MWIPACFNRNLDGCLETLTIVTLHFALIDFWSFFCNFPRKGAKSMPWPFVAVEMLAKVQSTLSPCQHWSLTLVHPRYHCKDRLFSLHDLIWGFPIYGGTTVHHPLLIRFSLTKTIQLLGYPHDCGTPHMSAAGEATTGLR